jgi:histidine triad (HIT) family protein
MPDLCAFCEIASGNAPASIVWEDDTVLAVVDLRQFHAGHTLVMPRKHVPDVRDLDDATGAALMALLIRVTRAVSVVFPSDGLSLWHSIGAGANQEVPHLHIHVHPRLVGDELLRVYPSLAALPDRSTLRDYAEKLRDHLNQRVAEI